MRKSIEQFKQENLLPLEQSLDETIFKPIKNFIKPITDVLLEYPATLKVSIGFMIGCVSGVVFRQPVLIRGVYGACQAAGAIAVTYAIDQIGAKLELKASTITLMHAFGSALRSAVGLVAGVAMDIFKTISGWAIIGLSISFIFSLKKAYDLRCAEVQAEEKSS